MLTERQKDQIILLRDQGIGYGTIAQRLKIPRSTISSYCLRQSVGKKSGTDREQEVPSASEGTKPVSRRKNIVCTVTITYGA